MTSDLDIYRSAAVFMRQHGERASWEAAARVDDMIAKGDPAGEAVWKRIARAVEALQREPTAETARH